jgi:hypothetical protein
LHSFGTYHVATQYTATREEAEQKATSMFKAVGATDFSKRPAVVKPVLTQKTLSGLEE